MLRTGLDLASAEDELDLAQAERDAAAARLDILLARGPGEPVEVDAAPSWPVAGGPPGLGPGDLQGLVAKALAGSTQVAALQSAVEAAEARVALARAQRVPDPVLSAGVDHDNPPDFVWGWRAGLGLTLPVFTTHRAGVTVAERELARSTAERDALSARLAAEIGSAASLVSARAESVRRFRETMQPRAAEIQELAEEAYRAGQSDLAELFQALGAARDIRARGVQAELDLQLAIADLEEAAGVPLP
jgi:cobalt-zinc-cadmium efflux system outer membrane protein